MSVDRDNVLRVLKGAPLSVLLSVVLFGPGDQRDFMVRTGWKREAVGDALLVLESYGLVVREHYRKWSLGSGYEQLGLFETPGNRLSESYQQPVDNIPETPGNSLSDAERRKSRSSALVSSSGDLSTNYEEPDPSIIEACHSMGIFGVKAEQLACMVHVVDYGSQFVIDHVREAPNVGMAIYRIEKGWQTKRQTKKKSSIPPEYRDVVKS